MSDPETSWTEVLAKATALLALKSADVDDDPLARANFLMGLGISQSDATKMLGLGVSTISNAKNRLKNAKKGGGNAKRKGKR